MLSNTFRWAKATNGESRYKHVVELWSYGSDRVRLQIDGHERKLLKVLLMLLLTEAELKNVIKFASKVRDEARRTYLTYRVFNELNEA